jgi:hypothetical protein
MPSSLSGKQPQNRYKAAAQTTLPKNDALEAVTDDDDDWADENVDFYETEMVETAAGPTEEAAESIVTAEEAAASEMAAAELAELAAAAAVAAAAAAAAAAAEVAAAEATKAEAARAEAEEAERLWEEERQAEEKRKAVLRAKAMLSDRQAVHDAKIRLRMYKEAQEKRLLDELSFLESRSDLPQHCAIKAPCPSRRELRDAMLKQRMQQEETRPTEQLRTDGRPSWQQSGRLRSGRKRDGVYRSGSAYAATARSSRSSAGKFKISQKQRSQTARGTASRGTPGTARKLQRPAKPTLPASLDRPTGGSPEIAPPELAPSSSSRRRSRMEMKKAIEEKAKALLEGPEDKAPPAVRPDLAIKRNETKLILEKEVKLTLWMEELELNASLQALPGEAEAQEWSRRELW